MPFGLSITRCCAFGGGVPEPEPKLKPQRTTTPSEGTLRSAVSVRTAFGKEPEEVQPPISFEADAVPVAVARASALHMKRRANLRAIKLDSQ
jgi:hypothetical protein